MASAEVFRFFETVRVRELVSFRALCNALKALIIERAVAAWRDRRQGRLAVLDLGCGRGGDLRKWARFRLKSYVGVDGAAACIEEARERQSALLSQGRSSLAASFHVADLLSLVPAVIGLGAIVLVGRLALRPMLKSVAKAKSEEMFMAACLLVIIGAGLAAQVSGLSMALGAFVAGILVGADSMGRAVSVPNTMADVIVAASLVAVLVAGLFVQYRVRWGRHG